MRLLSFTVLAAETGDNEENKPGSLLNAEELPLYAAPEEKFPSTEREAGQLEERIATVRKLVEPYAAWCWGTYTKIKPKVHQVIQFGNDAYGFLQNPPNEFYGRAGIIGFTGLIGLFVGRSSRIKRLMYPVGLMTVTASMYYPEQAAAITKSTGETLYDSAVRGYAAMEKILNPQNKDEKISETKP